MEFANRTVVVTGAANGIGRAMVSLFHAEGASLVAADIDASGLALLSRDLPDIAVVQADISAPAGADDVIAAAAGRVDVLCNNAGVSDGTLLIEEVTESDWAQCLAINLTGAFLLCRRALPLMVSQGEGVIINTASVAGLRGGKGGAAYVASKFGLIGLTQNIAASYGSRGVRCNAICPGPVDTHLRTLAPRSAQGAQRVRASAGIPLPAAPRQVAAIALMLAQDKSGLINGAAIPAEDGWLAY
jgi:NAD(P)-dependent dehydrogenase (short-subunit alcohol dehydrogenase family)